MLRQLEGLLATSATKPKIPVKTCQLVLMFTDPEFVVAAVDSGLDLDVKFDGLGR